MKKNHLCVCGTMDLIVCFSLQKPNTIDEEALQNLSEMNKLQHLWYQGKCNEDVSWCA